MRAEILKINSEKPEASLIRYAADQIRAGLVLGMPTDTFYGLAADPFNLRAVDRVYEIKSRSRHKPLSLLIESEEQAEELAKPLPDEFYKLARRFWPGPLTIIVKAASRLPLESDGQHRQRGAAHTQRQNSAGRGAGGGNSDHRDFGESERGVGVHDRGSGARSTAGAHFHHRGRRRLAAGDGFDHC